MNREKRVRPTVDESRGRKFAEAMKNPYGWRQLTGQQLEHVVKMAECFHNFMRQWRKDRTDNP